MNNPTIRYVRLSPEERERLNGAADALLRILSKRDGIATTQWYWSANRERLLDDLHSGTALSQVARWGAEQSVKFLLSIDRLAPTGPALAAAAIEGQAACVKLLLTRESARHVDEFGRTALTWAIEKGHSECVRLLAPLTDPKHRTRDGETAIQRAVAWRRHAAADLLAPWSDPRHADAALKTFGAERMPMWAARKEAEAIEAIVFAPRADGTPDEPARERSVAAPTTLAHAIAPPTSSSAEQGRALMASACASHGLCGGRSAPAARRL